MDVSYLFGHGLSYTCFAHTDLRVTQDEAGFDVTLTVANTGSRAGHEVVQVYVGVSASQVRRPVRELKAFGIVSLQPGEARGISPSASPAKTSRTSTSSPTPGWSKERTAASMSATPAETSVSPRRSPSRDAYMEAPDADSTIEDQRAHPVSGPAIDRLLERVRESMGQAYPQEGSPRYRMIADMRLSRLAKLPIVPLNFADMDELLAGPQEPGPEPTRGAATRHTKSSRRVAVALHCPRRTAPGPRT